MKTELLAPAKNKQTAFTAINCGADAVYIGAANFGARKNAPNSLSDIKEIVDYAHKFYVKVFVTLNTILTDDELVQAKELIHKLYEIGVDALIVQDFGILELAKNGELPPIPLHASTQCNNRDFDKVNFFKELGLKRIILARELSLEQIEKITKTLKHTEIEVFVHGALCVSYSGQCYLSQYIGGRSANRGECAQPCRKKYSLVDEDGNYITRNKHLLSLKDFNASKHLKKLCDIGVKSFKIEGRLKDETYIKTVVSYYRRELDRYSSKTSSGIIKTEFTPVLEKSFNRGFTDYFLEKRHECYNFNTPKSIGEKLGKVKFIGKDYFELDSNPILNPQDGLCFMREDLQGFKINKTAGRKIFPNRMPAIKIGDIIYRNFDSQYEKDIENAKFIRKIRVNAEITTDGLTLTDEDENRIILPLPTGEEPKNQQRANETFLTQFKKTGESDFEIEHLYINCDLPFMPVSAINEFRRGAFEQLMAKRLENYPQKIQRGLKETIFPHQEMDYRANVLNESAKKFYFDHYCEVNEPAFEKEQPARQVELMRTKHCLKFAHGLCQKPVKLFLEDEKGVKFPLHFDCKNCEMVVLSPKKEGA
ncbi:MAG: U32 family peptidase [Fusobacterium sp.]|nr:U32 family peptidase [Fusobacterium sp.]